MRAKIRITIVSYGSNKEEVSLILINSHYKCLISPAWSGSVQFVNEIIVY